MTESSAKITKVTQPRKEKLEEIFSIFSKNPLLWGIYCFPHHFRSRTPQFHIKILREVLKNTHFACECPRESGKTTILSFLYLSWCIAYKKKRFIVIVQNTFNKSAENLNTIKSEFRNNKTLLGLFNIKIVKDSTGDSIFQHPDGFRTRILCKGSEQIGSVRGEKFGAYRPDLILIDDLEDDVLVKSPERRRDIQDLYDNALVPAGDADRCQFIAIGTILHDDCLMAKLVSLNFYKEYRKLFYRALYRSKIDGKLKSLWPEKWTVRKLINIRATKPEVFAKEYQGNPVSGGMRKFDKEDFRKWRIEEGYYLLLGESGHVEHKGRLSECRAAIGCDLAWDEKKESDDTVIMPALLTPNSDLLIDDYFNEKGVRPDQFEEVLFKMEDKYKKMTGKSVIIGFEKAKLEKVMKWFLKQAMRRRNRFLNIKDIPWVTDKIARIVTPLQPRYKLHSIYHKSGMGELEYQLLRVPSGTHDDLPDAEQIACRCLEYEPTKPKTPEQQEDPMFDWLRQREIKKRKMETGKGGRFAFGHKTSILSEIPAKETWR